MGYFTWGKLKTWHINRPIEHRGRYRDDTDGGYSYCRNVCNDTTPGFKRTDVVLPGEAICKHCLRIQKDEDSVSIIKNQIHECVDGVPVECVPCDQRVKATGCCAPVITGSGCMKYPGPEKTIMSCTVAIR